MSHLLRDGYAALQGKDWVAARDLSLKASELAPRNALGWSYLAKAYQNLAQFPKAGEAHKTAIGLIRKTGMHITTWVPATGGWTASTTPWKCFAGRSK